MCKHMCKNSINVVRAVRGRLTCRGEAMWAELRNQVYDLTNLPNYLTNLGLTEKTN